MRTSPVRNDHVMKTFIVKRWLIDVKADQLPVLPLAPKKGQAAGVDIQVCPDIFHGARGKGRTRVSARWMAGAKC